jgi:diaminopropionate ammonia-lyase
MPVVFNREVVEGSLGPAPGPAPLEFHRRLPGYTPTPLHELRELATSLGLGALLLKDESERLGLPAFKVLGASWAIYRELVSRLGSEPGPWTTIEDLARRFESLRPLELVAATDGNHGRSVARVAHWLGLEARVLVPRDTVRDRIESIASEGARVIVVDGTYDEAVRRAAELQGERSLLVQDGGWPGYERVPEHVVEGYETMFREIVDRLPALDQRDPEVVLVQVGVGSLAAAVVRHYRSGDARSRPRIIGVEPVGADCAYASIAQGAPVSVPGPHRSMMAGLNCGTLSTLAWPWLRRGLDAVVTVDDERAAEAMRALAKQGVVSGESGAAGLAGLIELTRGPQAVEARERLGLDRSARVLLFSTEGITDRDNYDRVVGDS